MEERQQPIIIKKKKRKHEAAHGGAWKVAYADFITALMAFFLVMWLLAMAAPQKRAAMAEYFREYNIFKESGRSFMEGTAQVLRPADQGFKQSAQDTSKGSGGGKLTSDDLVKKLKSAIDDKLKSVSNQVLVDIIEGGVRVQIIDDPLPSRWFAKPDFLRNILAGAAIGFLLATAWVLGKVKSVA